MRPEIIVPRQDEAGEETHSVMSGGLTEGMVIRIIREPYFGNLGTVTELPAPLVALESEAKVRVLKARLEGGEEVLVPRANVEMIEG
jgi:hypothetical protein